jgi:uncharacterized protein YndB with AHSA1/START domain
MSDEGSFTSVIERTYDAPRDRVWQAWTEAKRLAQWWGPKGFKMLACTVDLRPGGLCHYGMQAPNGFEMWGKLLYREISPPHRLAYVVSFSDKDRGTTRHFASATWPLEVLNTVTLIDHEGKTTVRIEGYPINATAEERKTFEAGSIRGARAHRACSTAQPILPGPETEEAAMSERFRESPAADALRMTPCGERRHPRGETVVFRSGR